MTFLRAQGWGGMEAMAGTSDHQFSGCTMGTLSATGPGVRSPALHLNTSFGSGGGGLRGLLCLWVAIGWMQDCAYPLSNPLPCQNLGNGV